MTSHGPDFRFHTLIASGRLPRHYYQGLRLCFRLPADPSVARRALKGESYTLCAAPSLRPEVASITFAYSEPSDTHGLNWAGEAIHIRWAEYIRFISNEFRLFFSKSTYFLVGASGFEPLTPSASRKCSPPELRA